MQHKGNCRMHVKPVVSTNLYTHRYSCPEAREETEEILCLLQSVTSGGHGCPPQIWHWSWDVEETSEENYFAFFPWKSTLSWFVVQGAVRCVRWFFLTSLSCILLFSRRLFSSPVPAVLFPVLSILHSVGDGKGLATSQFFDAFTLVILAESHCPKQYMFYPLLMENKTHTQETSLTFLSFTFLSYSYMFFFPLVLSRSYPWDIFTFTWLLKISSCLSFYG